MKSMTRKIVIAAGLVYFGAAALLAQTAPSRDRQGAVSASTATATADAAQGQAAKARAFAEKYCVSCHNKRAALPADGPVNLEPAAFDDLLGHAATFERVLRKLSVRAMPPQGLPRPTEAEYAAFTSWLATSVDRAWEGHSTPGRYVVHRLNRAEYAN